LNLKSKPQIFENAIPNLILNSIILIQTKMIVEAVSNFLGFPVQNDDEYYGWVWWLCQAAFVCVNLRICFALWWRKNSDSDHVSETMKFCATIYCLVCSYRAIFFKNDVERHCWFPTWVSCTVVGRTLATCAEMAYITMFKLAFTSISKELESLGRGNPTYHRIIQRFAGASWWILFFAQCCCWRCVTTGFKLWSALEESLWTLVFGVFGLAAVYLRSLLNSSETATRQTSGALNVFIAASPIFVIYMVTTDVPMYINQTYRDIANGRKFLSFTEGFMTGLSCASDSRKWSDWMMEAQWQTPYFTVIVFGALMMACFPQIFQPAKMLRAGYFFYSKKNQQFTKR
jgi:hypothetical protein